MEKVSFDKVKEIIIEKVNCPADQVKESVSFQDLGLDSLDAVELIMAFEEEYGIEITDEEADQIKTVGDVMECITKKQV